ncbi:flagellar hook-length control protein FliK [Chitinibacter tainanensis]|uniref:flagellar hook-length control protein FliK n=1 Tax=Chitinibacter tainanensis TaxID=230667 RepID=UPI002352D682|nr:flagellar hook-length control protein FliK [Chitinibacter tainanensis]
MAANTSNTISALTATPSNTGGKTTRDNGKAGAVEFGAQLRNELGKQREPQASESREKPAAEAATKAEPKPAENQAAKPADKAANQVAANESSPAEQAVAAANTVVDPNVAALLAAANLQALNKNLPQLNPATQTEAANDLAGEAGALNLLGANGLPANPEAAQTEEPSLNAAVNGLLNGQNQRPQQGDAAAKIAVEAGNGLPLNGAAAKGEQAGLGEFSQQLQTALQAAPAPVNANPQHLQAASHNTATPVPSHYVATPVNDPRWGDAVAQRVSLMLGKQEQQIQMQLNPPNLGPMEVQLNLGGEQASVVFTSQQAAVREALAAATPKLTALLADQGIVLNNVQVASESLQQQQQNAFAQQQSQQRQSSGQPALPYGQLDAANGTQVLDRVINLSDVRVPGGSTRVSLFV